MVIPKVEDLWNLYGLFFFDNGSRILRPLIFPFQAMVSSVAHHWLQLIITTADQPMQLTVPVGKS